MKAIVVKEDSFKYGKRNHYATCNAKIVFGKQNNFRACRFDCNVIARTHS